MHRCYLVSYDVRDEKRLRRVFRRLKGYGQHWQLSVFFCVLKKIDRVRLQSDLEGEMNLKEDQVIILDLGPDEKGARSCVTVLGQPLPLPENRMIVI
jgi:CRISPR-associated protein Cas2